MVVIIEVDGFVSVVIEVLCSVLSVKKLIGGFVEEVKKALLISWETSLDLVGAVTNSYTKGVNRLSFLVEYRVKSAGRTSSVSPHFKWILDFASDALN